MAARMQQDYALAKKWMHTRRGYPMYNKECYYADTKQQAYASGNESTIDTIFTSLDTGLSNYFCTQMFDMYSDETSACIKYQLDFPECQDT